MAGFRMCSACEDEYHDVGNPRFHAQPNACPVCGPRLLLINGKGEVVPCVDAIAATATAIKDGQVVAIKGLGGFHLACDAISSVHLDRKLENLDRIANGAEFAEGLDGFFAKRPPSFRPKA